MSLFDDMYAAAAQGPMLHFYGESVTLTEPGQAGSAITAMPSDMPDDDQVRFKKWTVLDSVGAVVRGWTINDGATEWMVWREEENDGGVRSLVCAECRSVTYRIASTGASSSVFIVRQHLPDMSPATQTPYQKRVFWVPTTVLTPARQDQITDGTDVFTIENLDMEVHGFIRAQAKIGQVRA